MNRSLYSALLPISLKISSSIPVRLSIL
jgi:hypothetical protein